MKLQRFTLLNYLTCMETRYQTLTTLYTLVKDTPQPTQYQCVPRQLILLMHFDWANIYKHLLALEFEGLVRIVLADNVLFSITEAGCRKAVSIIAVNEKTLNS